MLHDKFVDVPIDKACGNVAFICQKHYAQVLVNELGLNNVSNIKSTYLMAIKAVNKVVSDNALFLKNKFNLEINKLNKNLPDTY